MVHLAPFIKTISVLSQLPNSNPDPVHALAVRQGVNSDLPTACQSPCQVIDTMANCGASLSCICASSIGTQLQQCMTCLVNADSAVESSASETINGWNQDCNGDLSLGGSSTGSSNGTKSSTVTNGGATGISSSSSSPTAATIPPATSGSTTGSSSSNPFNSKIGGAVSIKIGGMAVCIVAAFAGACILL